jgi:hypothetical protein
VCQLGCRADHERLGSPEFVDGDQADDLGGAGDHRLQYRDVVDSSDAEANVGVSTGSTPTVSRIAGLKRPPIRWTSR